MRLPVVRGWRLYGLFAFIGLCLCAGLAGVAGNSGRGKDAPAESAPRATPVVAQRAPTVTPMPPTTVHTPVTTAIALTPTPAAVVAVPTAAEPTAKPLATTAPIAGSAGLTLLSKSGTVARGSDAMVSAQTAPNAPCTIEVDYAGGRSTASGLEDKKSDAQGHVSWTWKVGIKTTPGDWPVIISCGGKTVRSLITVTK